MKLKKIITVAFTGIALLGLASCQNDGGPPTPAQETRVTELPPLVEAIVNVVDSHNNGTSGDSYILYDATTREYTTLSAEDYNLLYAFADVIVREENPITRAPQGNGWVIGGSGKGKTAAMKVAMSLANKLEKERDFEIHVEYGENGSFTVWYRYV